MDLEHLVRFCREAQLLNIGVGGGVLPPNSENGVNGVNGHPGGVSPPNFNSGVGVLPPNSDKNDRNESVVVTPFTVHLLVCTLQEMREHHKSVAKKLQYQNRHLRMDETGFEKELFPNEAPSPNEFKERSSDFRGLEEPLSATISQVIDTSSWPFSPSSSTDTGEREISYGNCHFQLTILILLFIILSYFSISFALAPSIYVPKRTDMSDDFDNF